MDFVNDDGSGAEFYEVYGDTDAFHFYVYRFSSAQLGSIPSGELVLSLAAWDIVPWYIKPVPGQINGSEIAQVSAVGRPWYGKELRYSSNLTPTSPLLLV